MFQYLKNIYAPQPDSPEVVAAKELNEARLDLLKAQKEREYWASMEPMLKARIARLTNVALVD